ncbi:hypothetical protein BLAT2472_10840 [Burkholderia latens]
MSLRCALSGANRPGCALRLLRSSNSLRSPSVRTSSLVTKCCAVGNGVSDSTRCGSAAVPVSTAPGSCETAGSAAARPKAARAPSTAAGTSARTRRCARPGAKASGVAAGLTKGVHIQESGSKRCGQGPSAVHPSGDDGGRRRACNKTGPARGLYRSRSTQLAGGPASNGGVNFRVEPGITKTLKKDDSVSLPMFRETLKILKRVGSIVSHCGKSG